jgi:EmrB/QacA subfamily drug resistance transporter
MEERKRNTVLTVLFVGVLMGALDIAIVGPALPAIRSSFGISERDLSWIFSLYVLFNLIGTPLMAKLSDQFGRRWIYIADVALFAAGSLIVAASPSFSFVLVGRAIQGFGAGGIFPVASAVIGDTFPAEKRGGALGLIGAVFGLAFLVGPVLGGVILSFASWKWLFLINLPIALVVIALSLRTLPVTHPEHSKRFDLAGIAALAVMLASLALAVNQIDTQAFFVSLISARVLPFLIVFGVLLFFIPKIERIAENPIVPMSLFDRPQLRLTYLLSAGAGFGEASLVFMPLLAVVSLSTFGISTTNASWMLIPVVLALAAGAPLAGRTLDRLGSKIVVLSGTALTALGMLLLGLFSGSFPLFIISGLLIGLGLSSLLGAPLRYIMLNEARVSERSVAQGVVSVFSSSGQLLGGALTGAIAASGAQRGGAAAGYSLAFLVIGFVCLVLVFMATFLKNRAMERETVRQNESAVLEKVHN